MAEFDDSKKYQEQEEVFVSKQKKHIPFILIHHSSTMVGRSSSCTSFMGSQISTR